MDKQVNEYSSKTKQTKANNNNKNTRVCLNARCCKKLYGIWSRNSISLILLECGLCCGTCNQWSQEQKQGPAGEDLVHSWDWDVSCKEAWGWVMLKAKGYRIRFLFRKLTQGTVWRQKEVAMRLGYKDSPGNILFKHQLFP